MGEGQVTVTPREPAKPRGGDAVCERRQTVLEKLGILHREMREETLNAQPEEREQADEGEACGNQTRELLEKIQEAIIDFPKAHVGVESKAGIGLRGPWRITENHPRNPFDPQSGQVTTTVYHSDDDVDLDAALMIWDADSS